VIPAGAGEPPPHFRKTLQIAFGGKWEDLQNRRPTPLVGRFDQQEASVRGRLIARQPWSWGRHSPCTTCTATTNRWPEAPRVVGCAMIAPRWVATVVPPCRRRSVPREQCLSLSVLAASVALFVWNRAG
jgi:hypothetical protein